MSIAQLKKVYDASRRNVEFWVGEWEKNRDVSGVRNAALAIGKLSGIYSAMLAVATEADPLPEDLDTDVERYFNIWDSLSISEYGARVAHLDATRHNTN